MSDEIKKKRGRPSILLNEEELIQRDLMRKAMAVKRQQRYIANNPEKIKAMRQKIYEPKVRIPIENKPMLEQLLSDTGLSFTQLCLVAIEEKYGVTLSKQLDNDDNQ